MESKLPFVKRLAIKTITNLLEWLTGPYSEDKSEGFARLLAILEEAQERIEKEVQ